MRKGSKASPELREKLRLAHLGKVQSPESIAKRVAANTGRKHSAEIRERMSVAAKTRVFTPEGRAKLSAGRKGRVVSAEARVKLSAALKGKPKTPEHIANAAAGQIGMKRGPLSAEHKAKQSAALKGRPRSEEHVRKILAAMSKGRRYEYNGHVFRSTYEVRMATQLDRFGIAWQYEPTRFDLGSCSYYPDFYLPDEDAYIEVKGYLGEISKHKIELFRQLYPSTPLLLANLAVIKQYEAVIH